MSVIDTHMGKAVITVSSDKQEHANICSVLAVLDSVQDVGLCLVIQCCYGLPYPTEDTRPRPENTSTCLASANFTQTQIHNYNHMYNDMETLQVGHSITDDFVFRSNQNADVA